MRPLLLLILGGLAVAVLLPLACARRTANSGIVRIEMQDYSFNPKIVELRAGQEVELELVNQGETEHEFLAGRETQLYLGTPQTYKKDFFEATRVFFSGEGFDWETDEGALELEVKTKGRVVLTFTVPMDKVGEWEIGCFVPDHYKAGMKGKLVVLRR